jgi:pimeloyl-ACP methyl ester carboxylesterase
MPGAQGIRFCAGTGGASIAYVVQGKGPPLLEVGYASTASKPANPLWRSWIAELARGRTYVRYDVRGFGISERAPQDYSLDSMLADLGAVADAAGLERFALIGHSSAGAVGVAYAALNPERVSRLLLFGSYARGRALRGADGAREGLLYQQLAQVGWASPDPAFRRLFTAQFIPDAPAELQQAHEELQLAQPLDNLVRWMQWTDALDVTAYAPRVACPTLVVHCRGDLRVSVEEASYLARLVPDSRLALLPSRNRILWEGEPAWDQFVEEVRAFLPAGMGASALGNITAREREVLELLARGLDNHQIAAHLSLSEKTVRNRVSGILAKLEVESRARAIVLAREAGYGTQVPP